MTEDSSYCPSCGTQVQFGATFCDTCGKPLAGTRSVAAYTPAPQTCPKCSQRDMVYTARAYIEQKHETPKTGRNSDDDRWEEDNVQEFLSRPERPELRSRKPWIIVPLIPILNFIGIWFAPLHKSYKYFMAFLVAVFIVCVAVPSLYKMDAYAFVGLTLLVVYYGGLIADRGRQRRELEQDKLPAYFRMLPNWDHLCYCQSCQISWLDSAPFRNVPVENTKKLLAS